MTDKRIKSYLEDRLKRLESIRNEREWTTSELGDIACCKQTLAFIDSLQEESKDKCKGCNNVKGCITCVDGSEWAHYEYVDNNKSTTQAGSYVKAHEDICDRKEPVSEDLGEYVNELSKQFPEVSFAKLSRIAVRVAKWQKQQDQSTIELAEDHAMLAGMEKMKEEMMAKAIDAELYSDGMLTPIIKVNDKEKISDIKFGDEIKVIVIKKD